MRIPAWLATHMAVAWFLSAYPSPAQGLRLTVDSTIVFARIDDGRNALTNRDDFIIALSRFDRAARMKTDREVTEDEFLAHVGRSVLPWSATETNKLSGICRRVGDKLAGWNVPLPPRVLLVKTSGEEEGHAAYTRQNAIILPERLAGDPELALEGMILHEIFHVMSRHQPELRQRLYHVIGFRPITAVSYPLELRDRKITNPDGYQTGWAITVTNKNRAVPAIPILYANQPRYESKRGGEFFDYLVFELLVVTRVNERWQPLLVGGHPQLLLTREAGGFLDQVGRNTDYLIHPDEILAENFVRLLSGRTNVASPKVIEGLRSILLKKEDPRRNRNNGDQKQ